MCGVDGSDVWQEQLSDNTASCPSLLSLCDTGADATSGGTFYAGDVAGGLFEDSGTSVWASGTCEEKIPLLPPHVNFQLYAKDPSEAKPSSDYGEVYFADGRRLIPGSAGGSLFADGMDSLETASSLAATTSTPFSRCSVGDYRLCKKFSETKLLQNT